MWVSEVAERWHWALAEYADHADRCGACGPKAPAERCAEGARLNAAEQAAYLGMRRAWWRAAA